ncbi:hypothetical protein AVEN_209310-1 [Araneus ventricosus]|uniref:Uncharacterized protein n=1 Tax=Araneus ventricosus TaxID=182803 RepID=A0A4Y2CBA5_ARAVE|nr:hypothetical protein AVEN_209310-1 [Araneus ventricosus]
MLTLFCLLRVVPPCHAFCESTSNATHRMQIFLDTMAKLIMKYKRTGSVTSASRFGTPKKAIDEGMSTQVIAAMARNPAKELDVSLYKFESAKGVSYAICGLTCDTHTSYTCCNI